MSKSARLRFPTELEVINLARGYGLQPGGAKAWAFCLFSLGWRPAEIFALQDHRDMTRRTLGEYHRVWREVQTSPEKSSTVDVTGRRPGR